MPSAAPHSNEVSQPWRETAGSDCAFEKAFFQKSLTTSPPAIVAGNGHDSIRGPIQVQINSESFSESKDMVSPELFWLCLGLMSSTRLRIHAALPSGSLKARNIAVQEFRHSDGRSHGQGWHIRAAKVAFHLRNQDSHAWLV